MVLVTIAISITVTISATAMAEDNQISPSDNDNFHTRIRTRAEELVDSLVERTNTYIVEKSAAIARRNRKGFGVKIAAKSAFVKRRAKRRIKHHHDVDDDDDDADGTDDEETRDGLPVRLAAQPGVIQNVEMRKYQLEGLNWLIGLYHSGICGILADEMGLGKTLQTVAFLAVLKMYSPVKRVNIVLTPLSTLGNWVREFERFAPSLKVIKFHGTKEERANMRASDALKNGDFDVLVTSYEIGLKEKGLMSKFDWHILVVDEAHRLKNENSLLAQVVRTYPSYFRLLLTGTPLQNNLHELWALLNFLVPNIFKDSRDFDEMFIEADRDSDTSTNILASLHKILRPFMLRRLKNQVATDLPPKKETLIMVGMSELQNKVYRGVLVGELGAMLGKVKEKSRLMNIMMQLRKAANHPYLFEDVEDRSLDVYGEHMVINSGKLFYLDKLLKRLFENGHRVLIFCQMTRMMDILDDYCIMRQYKYCRIDGNTSQMDRETQMRDFNADGSEKFLFLLSTRAGGLGINLYTADTVVLYDSDWNPQQDLQAIDRAHRIGQKRQVNVYRFIAEDTVEEKILERAEVKLRLDRMVIQRGAVQKTGKSAGLSSDELSAMIKFGAERIFRTSGSTVSDADIDAILARGEEVTAKMAEKMKTQAASVMQLTLDADSAPTSLIADEGNVALPNDILNAAIDAQTEALGRRERRQADYNVDSYYNQALSVGALSKLRSIIPKPYRIPKMANYQFYNSTRILELNAKEEAFYEEHQFDPNPETMRGITPEEEEELKALLAEGFDWSFQEHKQFLRACIRYGRSNIEKIVAVIKKPQDEVERYMKAFIEKGPTVRGFAATMLKIERGEARMIKFAAMEAILDRVIKQYSGREDLLENMHIRFQSLQKEKGYSQMEDRLLIWITHIVGYGRWRQVQNAIFEEPMCMFMYFLKSRKYDDLGRRVDALLRLFQKEWDPSYRQRLSRKSENGDGEGSANKTVDSSKKRRRSIGKKKLAEMSTIMTDADASMNENGITSSAEKRLSLSKSRKRKGAADAHLSGLDGVAKPVKRRASLARNRSAQMSFTDA